MSAWLMRPMFCLLSTWEAAWPSRAEARQAGKPLVYAGERQQHFSVYFCVRSYGCKVVFE